MSNQTLRDSARLNTIRDLVKSSLKSTFMRNSFSSYQHIQNLERDPAFSTNIKIKKIQLFDWS